MMPSWQHCSVERNETLGATLSMHVLLTAAQGCTAHSFPHLCTTSHKYWQVNMQAHAITPVKTALQSEQTLVMRINYTMWAL